MNFSSIDYDALAFIGLCVLTASFASLLIRLASFHSSLNENQKMLFSRRVGLVTRLWLIVIAAMGLMDVFRDFTSLPPKIMLAILPPLVGIVWMIRSRTLAKVIPSMSMKYLYSLQFFRVFVEIELFRLWQRGLVPEAMTFYGRNFDILVGLTAPFIGWLVYSKKVLPQKIAFVWNILGILILTNVVVTGILSTPTPLRYFYEDFANTAVGDFPYVWLPTVLVPIAYGLHVLAIRHYFLTKNSK